MRKANAANSLPNAKGSVNNATVVTNTNIARPTTVHATIEKSNSQSNDPKNSMSGSNKQNGKFVDTDAAGRFLSHHTKTNTGNTRKFLHNSIPQKDFKLFFKIFRRRKDPYENNIAYGGNAIGKFNWKWYHRRYDRNFKSSK